MEIRVQRTNKGENSTIGKLTIDGNPFHCFTLEDKVRLGNIFKIKIFGKTAIPSGRYEVVMNMSTRFKKYMPLLLNVPNFEGVRIHPGNTAEDTEGCLLVGYTASVGTGVIGSSKDAFEDLMEILQKVEKTEKIFITIQ